VSHTFEKTQGRLGLQRPRQRDLKPLPKADPSVPRRGAKRPHRPANQALFVELRREAARAGVSDASVLARRALQLFRAGVKEHGITGLTARAHLLGWALQTAMAHMLTLQAASTGLGTDRGLELTERAGKAQGRAERSWVAAVSAAGLLSGNRAGASSEELVALMHAAGTPRDRS